MTSRDKRMKWKFWKRDARSKKGAPIPLLLDRPVDDDKLYNSVAMHIAKYKIGEVVQHRVFSFRGVVFDVDPQFANSDEWYESIPEEVRPRKDQPFYHLFAENGRTHYIAYVSEENLLPDDSSQPVSHPDIDDIFNLLPTGEYELKKGVAN